MKPKAAFIIFTFLMLQLVFSIRLTAADTWTKTYRPFYQQFYEDDYSVEDVIITQDGGYVVSGSFELCDEFYSEEWGFLMKTDKDGNMLWARKDSVDFLGENENYACVETSEGDLITCGYQLTGGGYMIKRDSEGNRLWAIPYDDFGVNSMHKTLDDNIILGGRLYADIALRKIDNDGNTLWTNSIQIGTGSNAYSIYSAGNGDYLLTGVNYTEQDILVVRTDSNGDSLWTRTFEGLGGHDRGNCIIETNDGNYIVVGRLRFTSNYGGVIIKYNTNGDTLWTKVEPSAINNNFYSVVGIEDGIVSYGTGNSILTNLYKYNCERDSIWFHSMPKFSGYGDRCLRNLSETGFIAVGALHSYTSPEVIHLTKTDENGNVPVDDYEISQIFNMDLSCYPNPFDSDINILCTLKEPSKKIKLSIYNIKGQLIKELFGNQRLGKGKYSVLWNGKNSKNLQVSSGLYFIILKEDDRIIQTKKITLIKKE